MGPYLDAQVVLGVLAVVVLVLPALLASAYYTKQIFWPARSREDSFISRAEVQVELTRVDVRLSELSNRVELMGDRNDARHEELFRALSDLRVEIGRLAAMLEDKLPRPFRNEEKR